MSRVLERLDRFWFTEAPATRLAVIRILVGFYAAWLLQFRYDEILEATRLPARQFQPTGVTLLLSGPPPPQLVQALVVLAVVASVLFTLGVAYRVTGPLFAGLLLSVLTYYASWGSVNHPDSLVTAHIFVLGLTRAADALSVDAFIRGWRGSSSRAAAPDHPDPSGAWQYGFAIKLLCAVTVTAYLLAGIAKVSSENGWGWGTGEALLRQVAWDGLRKELLAQPPPPHAAALYQHVWLFTLLAMGSLVVELGAPMALLHRRIGYLWSLAAFAMHWGTLFVMGISFKYYLCGIAYASFFPWERLLTPLERPIGDALTGLRARFAALRIPAPAAPRLPASGRLVLMAVMVLVLGSALFGAGMLVGQGFPGRTASSKPTATPASRSNTGATARPTSTRAPKPTSAPTAASIAARDECPPQCRPFRVVWVGDTLLGDAAQSNINRQGYTWPVANVLPLLEADFVVGNHEAPITERRENYFPNEEYDYQARPESARALAEVGFKAIGLSNNHVLDRGPEGLADTLRYLREAGIQPFGAGLNGDEAAAPLLISTPHGVIGVLGFGEAWRQGAVAGPDQFGTLPFTEENIARGAQVARAAGARWVVAFVQWGSNYESVRSRQRQVAALFAKAGYSLVIGHHPHIVQVVDVIDDMPVLYSIGNFVFGTSGRFTPQAPGYGLVVRTSFGPQGPPEIELSCIVTDNAIVKYQPRPCDADQARSVVQSLGPRVTWKDGKGLLVR